ncbi:hypothetical protein OFY17_05470 [Marinomonas sp. C2222]|uniref:Uncharacterized protein n=1 Tax=Marinomonas sargassi TaxID=2984494 RepID=A0ABT2YRF6_9GAMM|nr:hypothetical protein [Marinomonas sargassi]MCV2402335.1 hypothetical protein [Marinomonas sargassi]
MQEDNPITPKPIRYSLGEPSERVIILQDDELYITHEYLYQTATPTRFYQYEKDTFCFVIKGSIYLKQNDKETALKEQQGVWLGARELNIATLLSPSTEICLIQFKKSHSNNAAIPLQKVSSGTVESVVGRNHTQSWPLWQGQLGRISLELYPPHYTEPLYYQKEATQYLLPLNGKVLISDKKTKMEECDALGKVFFKKVARAIANQSTTSVIALSITTSQRSSKGRVLILKRP